MRIAVHFVKNMQMFSVISFYSFLRYFFSFFLHYFQAKVKSGEILMGWLNVKAKGVSLQLKLDAFTFIASEIGKHTVQLRFYGVGRSLKCL